MLKWHIKSNLRANIMDIQQNLHVSWGIVNVVRKLRNLPNISIRMGTRINGSKFKLFTKMGHPNVHSAAQQPNIHLFLRLNLNLYSTSLLDLSILPQFPTVCPPQLLGGGDSIISTHLHSQGRSLLFYLGIFSQYWNISQNPSTRVSSKEKCHHTVTLLSSCGI